MELVNRFNLSIVGLLLQRGQPVPPDIIGPDSFEFEKSAPGTLYTAGETALLLFNNV